MAIEIKEGFKVYVNGRKSIIIDSNRIEECMQFYEKNNLDGVAITIAHDYKLKDVDFLIDYPEIRHVSISEGIDDISAIHSLINLESLMISGKKRKVDFSYFPLLMKFVADWSPDFCNMEKCLYLNDLHFYGYNPKSKDCSSIPYIPSLKKLKIVQSPINTLSGLNRFDHLEELDIIYCSKLETLCCLEKSKENIVSLLFDHCKSIKNHEYVKLFPNLNNLAYNDSGRIQSIKFIENLVSLKSFRFVGTDVIDGNMEPCIGLKFASFTNKKHFSHTMERVKTITKGLT